MDTASIIEIVPIVALTKIQQSSPTIAGFFNYRGTAVTVIDLCQLLQGEACRKFISTRLLIVNYLSQDGKLHHLGLMAEQVIETLHHADLSIGQDGSASQTVIQDKKGMIQLIDWKSLVSSISIPFPLMV